MCANCRDMVGEGHGCSELQPLSDNRANAIMKAIKACGVTNAMSAEGHGCRDRIGMKVKIFAVLDHLDNDGNGRIMTEDREVLDIFEMDQFEHRLADMRDIYDEFHKTP